MAWKTLLQVQTVTPTKDDAIALERSVVKAKLAAGGSRRRGALAARR